MLEEFPDLEHLSILNSRNIPKPSSSRTSKFRKRPSVRVFEIIAPRLNERNIHIQLVRLIHESTNLEKFVVRSSLDKTATTLSAKKLRTMVTVHAEEPVLIDGVRGREFLNNFSIVVSRPSSLKSLDLSHSLNKLTTKQISRMIVGKKNTEGCIFLKDLNSEGFLYLTDSNLVEIGELPNITHLNVSKVQLITDIGIKGLVDLCGDRLKYLNIYHCHQITEDAIMYIMKKCPNLVIFQAGTALWRRNIKRRASSTFMNEVEHILQTLVASKVIGGDTDVPVVLRKFGIIGTTPVQQQFKKRMVDMIDVTNCICKLIILMQYVSITYLFISTSPLVVYCLVHYDRRSLIRILNRKYGLRKNTRLNNKYWHHI